MEKVRGIVLTSFAYREREKILRVYAKEKGKLSFIMRPKGSSHLITAPLSEGEYIFHRQKGGLHSITDASLINPRLHLRKELSLLQSAGSLLQMVIQSQPDEHPSPYLYELLLSYLEHLPKSPNHPLLIASFKLKLLKHEGLIGETPPPSYTSEEWGYLLTLLNIKSYTSLYQLTYPHSLDSFVHQLYSSHFN